MCQDNGPDEFYTPSELMEAIRSHSIPEFDEEIQYLTVYKEQAVSSWRAHAFVLIETSNRYFTIERMPECTYIQECSKTDNSVLIDFLWGYERPEYNPATLEFQGTGTVAEMLMTLIDVNVIPRKWQLIGNNCQRMAAKVVKHHNAEGVRIKYPLRQKLRK